MTTLADFLLARIADDQAANRPGPEPEDWCDRAEGLHLSHARVLAECDAKRRIVEAIPHPTPHYLDELREWESCPKALTEPVGDLPWGPAAECTCGADNQNARGGSPILRLLALPYADHNEYRPEWKPT